MPKAMESWMSVTVDLAVVEDFFEFVMSVLLEVVVVEVEAAGFSSGTSWPNFSAMNFSREA